MILRIPTANPALEIRELREEIEQAIQRVLENGNYILGPEVFAFEQEFANYIGVSNAIGVASGTDALHLALRALGVGPGDEVITVAHTAVATIAAIQMAGATPVLVDIHPDTYTMDPDCLEAALTAHTRVIIPVHLYGHPADLFPILEIARKHKLLILEDCAQAHGARYHGLKVGSFGHMAAFSFYPTKNLGAVGDGGMVVTNDHELADKVRQMREYGWKKRYISEITGFNSRLDEIQAAILRVKLQYLDQHNQKRREFAGIYSNLLEDSVITPVEMQDCLSVYHLYVIRIKARDALRSFLLDNQIGTSIHYPVPIHLQPGYFGSRCGPLFVTEQITKEILSLPLYPQIAVEDVEEVVYWIKKFFMKPGISR